MSLRVAWWSGLLAVVVLAVGAGLAPAQEARQVEETDLNDLSMEVNALQTLSTFKFTDEQLQKLQTWAKDTAAQPRKREAAKVGKEYREKLVELRAALVAANDEDKIDQLSDELEELRGKENPTLDDGVDLTDAARKKGPQALRLLKIYQLTEYVAAVADLLFDPADRLVDALQSVRGLEGDAWKLRRQEIADEIVRLAAGVDARKSGKLTDQIEALLLKAHGMSKAEFKAKRQELENAAHKLLGNLSPVDVLRNETEFALAELLSNPRLPAALAARLKNAQ